MDVTTAGRDADSWDSLSLDRREAVARSWGDAIYFCPECDEACRGRYHYDRCPRFPAEHDETGYVGTGTGYAGPIRRLARLIAVG